MLHSISCYKLIGLLKSQFIGTLGHEVSEQQAGRRVKRKNKRSRQKAKSKNTQEVKTSKKNWQQKWLNKRLEATAV